jgi:hypothetical protein
VADAEVSNRRASSVRHKTRHGRSEAKPSPLMEELGDDIAD